MIDLQKLQWLNNVLILIFYLFSWSLKERRHREFVDIKKQIILCMDDLDQLPDTSFEKDVVCEDEEAFCLSNDNITALKLLLSQVRFAY